MSNNRLGIEIDQEVVDFIYGKNDLKYLIKIEPIPYQCAGLGFFHDTETGRKWCDIISYDSFVYVNDKIKVDWTKLPNDVKGERLIKNNWKRLKEGYNVKLKCSTNPYKIMNFLKNNHRYTWEDEYANDVEGLKKKFEENGEKHKFVYKNGNENFPKTSKIQKVEWEDTYQNSIQKITNNEQMMVDRHLRIHKGIEAYRDLHKMYYDIETQGLDPKEHRIFQIGVLLNYDPENPTQKDTTKEFLFEITKTEDDEEEKRIIIEFFRTINYAIPDAILGYNVFNFDWDFIFTRCEILGIDPEDHIIPKFDLIEKTPQVQRSNVLNQIKSKLEKRGQWRLYKGRNVKLGNESNKYDHRQLYGYNTIDIVHAVRRAIAINPNIKKFNLKYIAEHNGVAKENRVYVPGEKIYKFWNSDQKILTFTKNNSYVMIDDVDSLVNFYKGQPDYKWLQSLKGKLRKLRDNYDLDSEILELYDNEEYEKLRNLIDFDSSNKNPTKPLQILAGKKLIREYLSDDLQETMDVDEIYGQSSFLMSKMVPTDFEKLWVMGNASIWNLLMTSWYYDKNYAIPSLPEDRGNTGGLNRCILVGHSKRVFKADFGSLYPSIGLTYNMFPLFDEDKIMKRMLSSILGLRLEYKAKKNEAKKKGDKQKAQYYDLIQLPLKIIANSYYGALCSKYFNWGDADFGEKIPAIGKLHMRKFVKYMLNKGYSPLVMNTDGCNFILPEGDTIEDAENVINEYNDKHLIPPMLMEFEDYFDSEINLAKNNYSDYDAESGKMKNTGAILIKKGMPDYQKDFLKEVLPHIHKDEPQKFIEALKRKIVEIENKSIPAIKIADKKKVRWNEKTYKARFEKKTEKGQTPPIIDYMEIMIDRGIEKDEGETVYIVNTGDKKSHSDALKHKILIEEEQFDDDPNMLVTYNVDFYMDKFLRVVKSLLCVFPEEVEEIISKVKSSEDFELLDNIEPSFTTRLYIDKHAKSKNITTYDEMIADIFTLDDKEIIYWGERTLQSPTTFFDDYIIPVKNEPDEEAINQLDKELEEQYPLADIDAKKLSKKDIVRLKKENKKQLEFREIKKQQELETYKDKYYKTDVFGKYREEFKKREEFYASEDFNNLKTLVESQENINSLKVFGEYFEPNDMIIVKTNNGVRLKHHLGGAIFNDYGKLNY